jgi:hypothetical protein
MKSDWENYRMTQTEHDAVEKLRQKIHGVLEDRARGVPLSIISSALALVQTDILLAVSPSAEDACMLVRMMAKTMQEDMRTRKERERPLHS